MTVMKVKTKRPLRVYQTTKQGKLYPVGGVMRGRILTVEPSGKQFPNAPAEALRVVGMRWFNTYILKSDKNFDVIPQGYNSADADKVERVQMELANSHVDDPQESRWNKQDDWQSAGLDYANDMEVYQNCACDEYGHSEFDDYEFDDTLTDDVYLNADGEPCSVAAMAKMSRKQRKKCKKAVRVDKKAAKTELKRAEADEKKASAGALTASTTGGGNSSSDALIQNLLKEDTSGGAPAAEGSNLKTLMIAGGGLVLVIIIGGTAYYFYSKRKKAGATGAAASAVAAAK